MRTNHSPLARLTQRAFKISQVFNKGCYSVTCPLCRPVCLRLRLAWVGLMLRRVLSLCRRVEPISCTLIANHWPCKLISILPRSTEPCVTSRAWHFGCMFVFYGQRFCLEALSVTVCDLDICQWNCPVIIHSVFIEKIPFCFHFYRRALFSKAWIIATMEDRTYFCLTQRLWRKALAFGINRM